jgi:hypothetical protein
MLAGLLRDSVMLCCTQSYQLQRTPRGKLLKSKVLKANIRSHNAEVVSSSLTLATKSTTCSRPFPGIYQCAGFIAMEYSRLSAFYLPTVPAAPARQEARGLYAPVLTNVLRESERQ